MHSTTKGNTKNAKFYANPGTFVEVFRFPTIDINAVMDPDRPPKDGFFLRCEMLDVEGREDKDRTTQFMIAKQNVFFKTDKYTGEADIVTYNESTDIVTLEGLNGNLVRLFENVQNGPPRPSAIRSSKVLYNRKTGQLESAGVKSITN